VPGTRGTERATAAAKDARSEKERLTKGKLSNGSDYVLVLHLDEAKTVPRATTIPEGSNPRSLSLETAVQGTHARLRLMEDVSASKNQPGDSFEASLIEPVLLGKGVLLPEGSIFTGHIARRTRPRMLSRPGKLYLRFNRLTVPTGRTAAISATPVSVEVDRGSQMTIDSEGVLHGGRTGWRRRLLDLGITAGIAKVTDDSAQLIIELLVSSATDASTAGVSRIIAAGTSGLYFITRHGHDVFLPKYTEMDISLNQPISNLGRVQAQARTRRADHQLATRSAPAQRSISLVRMTNVARGSTTDGSRNASSRVNRLALPHFDDPS
jgi:hypothetical protein